MKIMLGSDNTPRTITLVLSKRDGEKIGALPAKNIKHKGNFNSFCELDFEVYKNDCDSVSWTDIKDLKLLWLKEYDIWFEIYVKIQDDNSVCKFVTAKSLGEAELSQINIYGLEVNTESDINESDYSPTTFYNLLDTKHSLLNRVLYKAPHYSILSVSSSLQNIQRTFSFDNKSIYSALQEISTEFNCYIDFSIHSDDNGKPLRCFSVYDLESSCLECGHRGEFSSTCENCGSSNIVNGYGVDSKIFISTKNLTDSIEYQTNIDSVKNCFKLEAGDDLMTATIINCNPNGSAYIWNITEQMKEDMPVALVDKLNQYDELYNMYQNTYSITPGTSMRDAYNLLVLKYLQYDTNLEQLSNNIVGFPELMDSYYGTIDFNLLLNNGLLPTSEIEETNASEQASKLSASAISPVSVYNISTISDSTVESYVLAVAKSIVNINYRVTINSGSYNSTSHIWTGSFIVESYYDETDVANSSVISININDNYENYVSQMLTKSLANNNNYTTDIVSLFLLSDASFILELKKYSLVRLKSFYDCCEACLNILIEQGAASGTSTWESSNNDLYTDLYLPYRTKQSYIQNEISLRESEINTINTVQSWIEEERNSIQNALNFENYLGSSLWIKFISYRRESTYSNNNYISDGLSNAELFSNARQFIEIAKKEIYKSSSLQHSISSTLKNLLVMKEFHPLLDNFELGNYIHIECDGVCYKLRLLSYEINYDNLDNLTVQFSDVTTIGDYMYDTESILDKATSMMTTYDSVTRQAEQGKSSRSQLDGWSTNGLSLTSLKIINNADNQDYVFDSHGMLFRKFQPISGTYNNEQLKIINSTIAITNDNWATVKTAIGSHYYIDPLTNQLTYGYGINGEVLIGKIILGESLGIYNSGATLKFNKDGLYVSNDDYTFTVNPNDTNKLLSISDGTNDVFKVTSSGLYISGEVNATSGNIGGCSIVDGVLKVPSANITGTLSASQIDVSGIISAGGLVVTGDLPTKTSDLQNDSGFENETGVVSIINGRITADYINALGITVNAANVTGTLTASQIDVQDVINAGNLLATNGSFSGTVNVNDNFIVDSNGDVAINGSISWGTGSSPTQALYSESYISKPVDGTTWSSYGESSSESWHRIYSSADYYASYTYDGGHTWTTAIQIIGHNGTDGRDGTDGSNGTNGVDGSNGSDGSSIKIMYLYYRKSSSSAPSKPTYSGGSLPSGWTTTPSGVTSTYLYEFVSQCTITNNSYGTWSTPVCWSKYGLNGSDGNDGVDGADGSDASVTAVNVFNALTSNGTIYGCFNSANNKLYINASYINTGTFTVENTSGTIFSADATSKTVTIAGWTVTEKKLWFRSGTTAKYSGVVTGDTSSRPSLVTSGNLSPVRFYAGSKDNTPYPDVTGDTAFGVLEDGSLYAYAAKIQGNIIASSGAIGGWVIEDGLIRSETGIYGRYKYNTTTTGTNLIVHDDTGFAFTVLAPYGIVYIIKELDDYSSETIGIIYNDIATGRVYGSGSGGGIGGGTI